mmetsp:Transcript_19710/g.53599  ORF Transcript_19710/g.53599 Transcript_19710/m.53599 type:complete len:327 (-) Transcript_19710:60-1040(-)
MWTPSCNPWKVVGGAAPTLLPAAGSRILHLAAQLRKLLQVLLGDRNEHLLCLLLDLGPCDDMLLQVKANGVHARLCSLDGLWLGGLGEEEVHDRIHVLGKLLGGGREGLVVGVQHHPADPVVGLCHGGALRLQEERRLHGRAISHRHGPHHLQAVALAEGAREVAGGEHGERVADDVHGQPLPLVGPELFKLGLCDAGEEPDARRDNVRIDLARSGRGILAVLRVQEARQVLGRLADQVMPSMVMRHKDVAPGRVVPVRLALNLGLGGVDALQRVHLFHCLVDGHIPLDMLCRRRAQGTGRDKEGGCDELAEDGHCSTSKGPPKVQ